MDNIDSLIMLKRAGSRLKSKGPVWVARRAFTVLKEQAIKKVPQQDHNAGYINLNKVCPEQLITTLKNLGDQKLKLENVQVENTRFCNLRCPGCLLTNQTKAGNWSASHMSFEKFKAICDNLPAVETLAIFNYGEPSLHPHFKDMIAYARQTGKFDKIISTSNLIPHNPEYYSELFDLGLDHLSISIDSFDPEIAEQLRTRSKIKNLTKNLERLIEERPNKFNIATVVSRVNFKDLENLYKKLDTMAANAGRSVAASAMLFSDYFLDDRADMLLELNDVNLELARLQDRFLNLKIPQIPVSQTEPTQICMYPWNNLRINVSGEIMLCGAHQEPVVPQEKCGLLENHSIEEIFTSDAMIEFFESYLVKSPEACSKCPKNLKR